MGYNRMSLEVSWYRKNGKYKSRIKKDALGREYVIGDLSWNGTTGSRPEEFIEHVMDFDIRYSRIN